MYQTTLHAHASSLIPQNDAETFDWLYKKFWQPLLNQSYYYLKDHSLSEEIVQQLFIDIFRKNILIRETGNIESYLRKAVKNRVYNYLLKDKRYRNHLKKMSTNATPVEYNSIVNEINMLDKQKEIRFYLSKLDETCRTVFILNRERQLTIKEIARRLQRPEDTVTKQLGKAVKYLHKCIYHT